MRRGLWVALALLTAACSAKSGTGTEGNNVTAGDLPIAAPSDTPTPSPTSTMIGEGDPARDDSSTVASTDASDSASDKPSFDCQGQISSVEAMICGDPHLAKMDRLVTHDYTSWSADTDAEGRAELLAAQREFLRKRNQCADIECLEDAYTERLADFIDD